MPYEPVRAKFSGFADLRIGEKFFFYCDRIGVGAEQLVKVSDTCFISLGMDGTGFGGLGTVCARQQSSSVERLGMLSEERFAEVTASYR